MVITSDAMDRDEALAVAKSMCAAARTAPKARGLDGICTMVLTGADKDLLADEMDAFGRENDAAFFLRDADNLRAAQALVLLGARDLRRGLGESCAYCGLAGCAANEKVGALCCFDSVDLGIAVGSAVALAADRRADTRVMYSAGRAALRAGIMGEEVRIALGIPVSVSGKSPFFDRKAKNG